MNKLVFALLLGFLFSACQNTPQAPAAPEAAPAAPAPAAPVAPTPEAMQQASDKLSTGIKALLTLRDQIDALPAKAKKANAKEINGFYSTIESLVEKQTMMLNEIKATTTPAGENASQETSASSTITAAQVQDYNESADRYAQEMQGIKDAVSKLATGGK